MENSLFTLPLPAQVQANKSEGQCRFVHIAPSVQEDKDHSLDLSKCSLSDDYFKQFFVGLLEGDGSINVTLKNNNYL